MIIPLCRLSIFGNFSMLEPTASNIISWAQVLQKEGYEMLPNVINSIYPINSFVDPAFSPQFIQFSEPNSNKACKLLRLTNMRIDAECSMIDSDDWHETIKSIFLELTKLLHIGSKFAENTMSMRLAYYVDVLIDESSFNNFQQFCTESNLGVTFPGETTNCFEWQHRFNQRISLPIKSDEEMCNHILTMEKNTLRNLCDNMDHNGLRVSVDINTLGENNTPRFSFEELEQFCSVSKDNHFKVLEQIMELINK